MKTGRNEPCPCGSGLKYKKCCLNADSANGLNEWSPGDLVTARGRAFDKGDFGFIYDSYHPESPFRSHFPERDEYLSYARRDLRGRYQIHRCQILREAQQGPDETLVLFYLEMEYAGERHQSLELSRFLRTADGWRYHSGHKVDRAQFGDSLEEITMAQVEERAEGLCF